MPKVRLSHGHCKGNFKGQITIPLPIRQGLGLKAGSRVEFVMTPEGRVSIEPVDTSLAELAGMFAGSARSKPVSIEEMDEAIADAVSGQNQSR